METKLQWIPRSTPPKAGRVLAFSPIYDRGDPMRFRILDAQFLRVCGEVEFWADLESAIPSKLDAAENKA